jgi:hypothetical protein
MTTIHEETQQIFGINKDEMLIVQRIVDHRFRNGGKEFLVAWKGYPEERNTWEPQQNFDCPHLIEEYENSLLQQSRYMTNHSLSLSSNPITSYKFCEYDICHENYPHDNRTLLNLLRQHVPYFSGAENAREWFIKIDSTFSELKLSFQHRLDILPNFFTCDGIIWYSLNEEKFKCYTDFCRLFAFEYMKFEQFPRDVTKQNSNQFSSLISPVVINDNFINDFSYSSNGSSASIDQKRTIIPTHTEKSASNFSLKFSNPETETPDNTFNPTTSSFSLVPTQPASSSLLHPITNPAPHPTIKSLLDRLRFNFDKKKCSVTQTKIYCNIETYRHSQLVLKSYLLVWQLPIDKNDYRITIFVALVGLYQWIIFCQNTHPAQPVLPTDRPPTANEFISCHFLKLMVINFVYVDALPGTIDVL